MARGGAAREWTNWARTVQCEPREVRAPDGSLLPAVVAAARAKDMLVRPRGAGHSFVPLCATDGQLIEPENMAGIVAIDHATRRATIQAGTVIAKLGEPLNRAGLALANQGDIDVQTIGGAIGTGTHGTGLGLGSLSGQLTELTLLTASGEIHRLSASQYGDMFHAAGVSMGSLGIFLDVTLQLVPRYVLREENSVHEVADCCAVFPSMQAAYRNVEFFWLPEFDQCVVKSLRPTSEPLTAEADMDPPLAPPGTIERYLRPSRTHWSHRIYPSKRTVLFNEMEFAVPLHRGLDCFLEIRELMTGRFADVNWAVEYRTLAADHHWLSQAYGADAACISVHEAANRECEPFFRAAQEIFLGYGGRPHWGKTHFCESAVLARLYPRWDDFQRVRHELDPQGLFLNPYLRTLFGVDD